jgi:hypothetical protein
MLLARRGLMQRILDHLNRIVRPALREYAAAERSLNAAHDSKDRAAIDAARDAVIRKARTFAPLNSRFDGVWHTIGHDIAIHSSSTAFA